MALNTKKPEGAQDFINKAKADPSPTPEPKTEDVATSAMKDKTFLLKLSYSLWKKAKQKATERDITLHDFIIEQIKKGL